MDSANGQHEHQRLLGGVGGDRRLHFLHRRANRDWEDVVNGKASYYAWYEMYPSASITIATTTKGTAFTVEPDDLISGSVAYSAAKKDFVLTITDTTESESFSTTLTAKTAALSSAEWVC